MQTLLVADTDQAARRSLANSLAGGGRAIREAKDVHEVLRVVRQVFPDLIMLDSGLSGMGGLDAWDLLCILCDKSRVNSEVVVLAEQPSTRMLLRAEQIGVKGVLSKPVDHPEAERLVSDVLASRSSGASAAHLAQELSIPSTTDDGPVLVGRSSAMVQVRRHIDLYAPADVPVLIEGPTGTGKELVARLIHLRSERCVGPFEAVNAGAVPEGLVESTLFGHVKGSFTTAIADHKGCFARSKGGTLFLDEISEAPVEFQVKLLRVTQDGGYTPVGGRSAEQADVRLVAATNRALDDLVAVGGFRSDLLFRLGVARIRIPPLAQRLEDIEDLAS